MIASLDIFCIGKSLNPFKSICQILLNFANDWCISVFVNEHFFFSKLHVFFTTRELLTPYKITVIYIYLRYPWSKTLSSMSEPPCVEDRRRRYASRKVYAPRWIPPTTPVFLPL